MHAHVGADMRRRPPFRVALVAKWVDDVGTFREVTLLGFLGQYGRMLKGAGAIGRAGKLERRGQLAEARASLLEALAAVNGIRVGDLVPTTSSTRRGRHAIGLHRGDAQGPRRGNALCEGGARAVVRGAPCRAYDASCAVARGVGVLGAGISGARPGGRGGTFHEEMQLGPVRVAVSAKASAAVRGLSHGLVIREPSFSDTWSPGDAIQDLYAAMAADEARNALVLDDVISALEEGRSPLLLTERRDHLEFFVQKLRGATRHLVVLHGGLSARARKEALASLAEIPAGEERPVLARMMEKRIRAYRAIGYEIEASMRSAPAEHVIEYDEDA